MTNLTVNSVTISLGSNLGKRKKNIQECIKYLQNLKEFHLIDVSSLYETSPMYNPNQQEFINCVLDCETTLKPLELLDMTQLIEIKMGRDKSSSQRNQPRKIDIDILTYNNEIIKENRLVIPHPLIAERKFVLIPLFELKGNILIPGYFKKIEDLIKQLNENSDKIRQCNYRINEEDIPYSS